jgi:hypothetical protein
MLGVMLAALGCVAVWQMAGCRKPAAASPAIAIEHEIAPWPARVGAATVTLRLSDARGQAVSGARIALEADMSHAGMRPEFGEAREIGAGRYQGRLAFTMAGDWVILMHIILPGGQKLERQMEVRGVRAN